MVLVLVLFCGESKELEDTGTKPKAVADPGKRKGGC